MMSVLRINANKEREMRKLVVTEFLSLDGVMENPMWTFPYWNDEIAQFKGEEGDASDALLLGRVTYQGFAAAWPESKDEGAPYFNSIRKYVASTTLEKAEWNNSHIIKGNVAEEITKLKQQDGKNIVVHGSGRLIQALIRHDLIDEYRLLIYPLVLGKGQRLFEDEHQVKLNLVASKVTSSGVVALVYEPKRKA
jgi:dihydrofolate reductase